MTDTSQKRAALSSRWILLAARLSVGGVFLYAGFTKMRNPQEFADSVASFRMLPVSFINIFALALPPMEMFTAGMLVTGWRLKLASFSALLLSCTFTIALGQALIRGLQVDCGCFGSGDPSLAKSLISLGRDLMLIAASAWIYNRSFSENKNAQ